MGFSRQEYWSDLPFPFPVDHILSELSTMTRLSWVALHGKADSFTELDKAAVHVIRLVSFLWLWFQSVCPLMPSQRLPSYWGFSYLGYRVSLHGSSSKVQPWSGGQPRRDNPHPRSAAAAGRRYPTFRVSDSKELLILQVWYDMFYWKESEFLRDTNRLIYRWNDTISETWFFFSIVVAVDQSLSCVRLFVTPWTAACQASLFFTISWSLLKLMSIE